MIESSAALGAPAPRRRVTHPDGPPPRKVDAILEPGRNATAIATTPAIRTANANQPERRWRIDIFPRILRPRDAPCNPTTNHTTGTRPFGTPAVVRIDLIELPWDVPIDVKCGGG